MRSFLIHSFSFSFFLSWAALVAAQYSIYQPKNQVIFGGSALHLTATSTAAATNFTGAAAYDSTILNPPAVPNPAIPSQIPVQLTSSGGIAGLSIPQNGGFFGFSIEMSVSNQVLGKNSSFLQVPFLNLMANIIERAGWVQLTNTHWYLGIPFNTSAPFSLGIVEYGQQILGDRMLGFQAGNEPDLYASHGRRPSTYSQFDYFGEIGVLVQQIANDSAISKKNNMLVVASVQTVWTPESVWNTGIVESYSSSISALAVERYPDDNCAALYPALGEALQNPQDIFINYLQHNASTTLISSYLNSTAFAYQNGKQFIVFETNTASCSGFPGISNSFGAALWALDWAFTMAYSNVTSALFHVGGQNAYYNPFTPPPTNQSTIHQWTVGPVYYSGLVMAEALGPSNASQIVDLTTNIYTPIYAIYENGSPTKVALFNFVTDPSGVSTYTAVISIGGGSTGQSNATPSQVQVKYLLAESVSAKGNFTWAGQTLGNNLQSDGRLNGTLNVTTVACDQNANTCSIPVPAPGFALVFLTSNALRAVSPTSTVTFPTTAQTRHGNTVSIDPSMLATSYGHSGMQDTHGATSPGSSSGTSPLRAALPGALALFVAALGAAAVALRWW
ncbi:hypothetical protein BJV78DRAFT_1151513 [Lactifluus subvellereus]|nr:hypothetical protein BJV78DRAFT_1151513 [Lactifluus subvellereus]